MDLMRFVSKMWKSPTVESDTGALVRVTHTAVCGSDLWFYHGERDREVGSQVGHEPMGIVGEVGNEVTSVEPGDRVFAPFRISCGECEFCRRGLHTSCVNGGSWIGEIGGARGEYIKTPYADGTLVRVPDQYADDEDTLESLLPLTDAMATGHHAAVSAEVGAADSCVVVEDGAVGPLRSSRGSSTRGSGNHHYRSSRGPPHSGKGVLSDGDSA